MCDMCRCYLYDRFSSPITFSEKLKLHIHRNSLNRCIPMLVKSFEIIFKDIDNMTYFVNNCYQELKKGTKPSQVDLHIWNEFISDYSDKFRELKFIQDELIFEGVFRKAINKEHLAKKFLASHLHNLLLNLYTLHFEHVTKTGYQEPKKPAARITDLQLAVIKSIPINSKLSGIKMYKEIIDNKNDPYNGLYD